MSFLGLRKNSTKVAKSPPIPAHNSNNNVLNHSPTISSPVLQRSTSNGSYSSNASPPVSSLSMSSPPSSRMVRVTEDTVHELSKEIQKHDIRTSNGSQSSDSSNLTNPSGDSEPVELETFLTRLRLPGGEDLNIQVPKDNMTISQYLTAGLNKIKDILGPKAELQDLSVQNELNETIPNNSIIQNLAFFKSCIDEGTTPTFFLVYDESSKVKRLDRKAIITHRTSSFQSGSPRDSSIVVSKQLREFQVQVLLPSGQTLVLQLNVDDTISEVKKKIGLHSMKFDLKPMEHYAIKTPSKDGWLYNETATVGSIPFIEECRHNSLIPKLVLGEKGATQTKKEKLINLEIGNLIGSPLCWTQGDSETNQFRKSMTWVRFQERKRAKKQDGDDGIQSFPWQQQGGKMNNGVTANVLSPAAIKKTDGKPIMLKLRLPLLEGTLEKTVITLDGETANNFTRRMVEKYYKNRPSDTGYILKVGGLAQFIDGDQPILNVPYIQSCVASQKPPQLQLLEREKTEDNDIYVEDFPEEQMIQDPKYVYIHEEIDSNQRPWDQMTTISMWELTSNFRVKILGAENVKLAGNGYYTYVTTGMYHGGELISPAMQTGNVIFSQNPRWHEWNTTNIQMCNIPRAARLCFTIWATKDENGGNKEKDIPLAWVNCQLIDYKHELRQGRISLSMWPEDIANPIGTCVGNNADINAATLTIEFNTYQLPVVFPTAQKRESETRVADTAVRKRTISGANPIYEAARIEQLIQSDPLYPLTEDDKALLWREREVCRRAKKQALPKLLRSVCYNNRNDVQTMHSMLETWPLMNPVEALELLDSSYGDAKIRAYAVKCLEALPVSDLSSYLLQLVQVLKYEPYHDSDLARFLLRRGLEESSIGHSLFWYLKAEMHEAEISERYGLLLEGYLRGCGIHRAELKKQILSLKELARTANHIKGVKDPVERLSVLKDQLSKITFPNKVKLPLNPEIEVSGLIVEKCKFMDSKKLPLWLVFNNADTNASSKYVIFKSGDDLRQDMLTLQMIRLMDKLWKADGLDLRLNAYGCISTGNEQGMIEVVLNSETVANITRQFGGATAAFRAVPVANWLKQNNPDYSKAVDNFVYSCAGYCVATYVLGIGDRHNDNVMITREGRLFHIDFGHFLGNFKKKFGFKRERAPFVFTPDFAYVMGGKDHPDFKRFVDLCCRSYNILRKYANTFINLFAMMLSTGIPELTSVDDIEYLRDAFSLGATEEQAKEKFTNLIFDSLDTKTTRLNNAIHIWAH